MNTSEYLNENHLEQQKDGQSLLRNEHTHFAKITENAKGEPSVTVSIMGDDEYEVHDQVMGLYTLLKKSLSREVKP
jgi:alpha-mannosidase